MRIAEWTFELSSRQRKALSEGKVIRVALPYPPTPIVDLRIWADSALPGWSEYLRAISVEKLRVRISPRRSANLPELLGHVYKPGSATSDLLQLVEAVVVTLSREPSDRVRPLLPSWPARAVRCTDNHVLGEK